MTAACIDASARLVDRLIETFVCERLVQEVDRIQIEAVKRILGMCCGKDEATFTRHCSATIKTAEDVQLDSGQHKFGLQQPYLLYTHTRLTEGLKVNIAAPLAEAAYDQQRQRLVVDGYA